MISWESIAMMQALEILELKHDLARNLELRREAEARLAKADWLCGHVAAYEEGMDATALGYVQDIKNALTS